MISVLLADDSELVRRAIRRLLAGQPEISLIGEATDFAKTLQMSNELHPHIVILDLHMADGHSIGLAEFRSEMNHAGSRVLAISAWDDEETRVLAAGYGAVKLLDKVTLGTHLVPSILEIGSPPKIDG